MIPRKIAARGHTLNTPADKRVSVASNRRCFATFAEILLILVLYESPVAKKVKTNSVYAHTHKKKDFPQFQIILTRSISIFQAGPAPRKVKTKTSITMLHKTHCSPTATVPPWTVNNTHNTYVHTCLRLYTLQFKYASQ